MKAEQIKLFDNLSQIECNGDYIDLHNDFDCMGFGLENGTFSLKFRHVKDGSHLIIEFNNVKFVSFYFDFIIENKLLTIDNLYRGRFESNGKLNEFSDLGSSYFYLEFYEGQTFEFFCNEVLFKRDSG